MKQLLGCRWVPAMTAGVVAVLAAGGGFALASGGSTINGCVHKKGGALYIAKKCQKHDKKLTWNKRGPAGPPGSALAYAHINPNGTFDAAHSKNVSAGNMSEPSTGFYCFKGLSFTPHNAVVSADYNGVFNGQIPETEVQLPGTPNECGSASQVMVFTGLVNPGVFTSGANLGFYVVFN